MSRALRHVGRSALLLICAAQFAAAQETVDRDPFSTPSIEAVIRAADRDRVSEITTELVQSQLSAIEQRIINEVETRLSALLDRRLTEFNERTFQDVDDRMSEMAGVISALRDEIPQQIERAIAQRVQAGSSDAAAMGLIPEGSVFVACVDGRSLYRDANGSTFYMDSPVGDSGVSRCSN